MVDHQDSFVHTLAGYFRETGADVITLRPELAVAKIMADAPDLVVLSPGPGRPENHDADATIAAATERQCPIFGVCLGLQALVTFFGGTLGTLPTPVHGKPSEVCVEKHPLFADMPKRFNTGRYHSLFADRETLPEALRVIADTDGGLIMGIAHASLLIAAVQFHAESIMSLEEGAGRRLIQNAVSLVE